MTKKQGFRVLPKGQREFVVAMNDLMNRAGKLKLWRTMHALHDAKRTLGWELAGQKEATP